MKKLITVIIFSLSLNAVACDGACREPSVVGTPVSANLEREIASVADLGKTEIADNFCDYASMNSSTSFDLFKKDLQELRDASISFNEIVSNYSCNDVRKVLWFIVEQDTLHGHHAFVQAFFDGLYQEGGMALVKQHLNEKYYYDKETKTKISIIEFVSKRMDTTDAVSKSHWTAMYNYIIQFA